MLKPHQVRQSESSRALLLPHPFMSTHANATISFRPRTASTYQFPKNNGNGRVVRLASHGNIRASILPLHERSETVKAIVKVKLPVAGTSSNGLGQGLDAIKDLFGKSLLLELVSTEVDHKTGEEKTLGAYARKSFPRDGELHYEANFEVPQSFGYLGAIKVENEHHKEMYVKAIILDKFPTGSVTINCNSWVHSKQDNHEKRVFFTNKSYLPSQTPSGLKKLREKELEILRGNGTGERKKHDRIYDYDKYNDLGDPDNTSQDLARPVMGGSQHPYPRRCRTGRPPTNKDPFSEKRESPSYVPRDEAFSEVKDTQFSFSMLKAVMHAVIPALKSIMVNDINSPFPYFTAIDKLFNEGINIPSEEGIFKLHIPRLMKTIEGVQDQILLFETPEMIDRDKFSWFKDEEFARQTLAGLNPYVIELITEWPLKSKLDHKIYGPPESKITTELIEKEIKGSTTIKEALKQKRLFILDYHDLLLPYVKKVRALEGTTLYGSRTVFFLNDNGTLRPLAIELTRPPMDGKPQWKHAFVPGWDATNRWLWKLAKAHVCAHDATYQQLNTHWLRTHCCVEPYIIAANRQLSAMHPIYRLLHPHFRYTIETNALARETFISAGGFNENCFSLGKYCTEFSSKVYDLKWRFDMEALPADLIRRGLAMKDPKAKHGLKLTIEDYPFANDGLILWDAIKSWVSDYVNHYYPTSNLVVNDHELQAWWIEVRTKGHGDKKDETWWPVLKTKDDLIEVLSTIIWVASGHHAAVNFGLYTFAGYFPNRPTIARTNIPIEEPIDHKKFDNFFKKPEIALLECFPSRIQAIMGMVVFNVLSTHSPDEEYLGDQLEPSWAENPIINAAFERFKGKLLELDGIIDARNADITLLNRSGAGVVPYQLLKPLCKHGAAGMGVPTSITI